MFDFFKSMFGRRNGTPQEEAVLSVESPAEEMWPAEEQAAPPSPTARRFAPQQRQQNGRGIELPVEAILNQLPLELQTRVRQQNVGDLAIAIPLEKILAQLSRGSVKISFGELRQAVPHVFTSANDRDRVLVPLPLGEIISRLNPALIARRRAQKQVEVPEDISGPFDAHGQGISLSEPAAQPATPTPPVAGTRRPMPVPAAHAVPAPTPPPVPAPQPIRVAVPARGNLAATPAAVVPAAEAPPAATLTAFSRKTEPSVGNGHPSPAAPAQGARVAPKPGSGPAPLLVSLSTLAEGWPDSVRQEIVQLNLVDSKVGLPAAMVEQALKQGKIAFSWKSLRSWISPAPHPSVSVHDGLVLELPLKVVAPIFLARQRETQKPQQQTAVDENIPNLFFGFPQAEPAGLPTVAQATAKPADTNYYVWDDRADTARIHESEAKRGPSSTTQFAARHATPNEIVSRAAALDGVAGALIALPDGLMVASRLSPDLNGDTLAAFLPQIFGKMSQCTKELRMGDLNNLHFTVGNVPWKIFRVNAIFFAAFGRPGQPLPTASLAELAGELDRKPNK
jgi:predicted regulator of Ras-like GTPase activity (Roadblock/LC7/MglB family)